MKTDLTKCAGDKVFVQRSAAKTGEHESFPQGGVKAIGITSIDCLNGRLRKQSKEFQVSKILFYVSLFKKKRDYHHPKARYKDRFIAADDILDKL